MAESANESIVKANKMERETLWKDIVALPRHVAEMKVKFTQISGKRRGQRGATGEMKKALK